MILYYKNITKKVSSYYMILAFVSCSHRMDVKNLTLELANNTTFNINNDEWEDDDDDNDTRISSLKLQEGDFLIAREARDRNRNKKNPKGSFRFVYTGIGCQFKEQVLTVNDNDNKDKDKTVDLSSIETRLKFFKIRTHDEKIYVPCKKSSSLTNNIDYDSIKPTISPNTQQIKNIEFQNSHLVGVTEIKGYIQENIIQRKTAGKIYFGYFNTQIAESNIETPVVIKEMKQLEYMQQQIASKLSLAPHIYDFIEIEEKNKKFIVMEKQDPCSSIVDHEILIGKKGEENVIQLAIKLQQLQEKWEESNYYLQKCPYHGDIKPENMTYNKDIGNLNLIDFKYDLQDITSTPFYSKFIELQDNLMTLEKNELVNKGFTTQINFKKSKATDFIAFFRSILSLKFVNQIDYSKIISFATNILEKKYESEVLNRIKQTKLCNIKKNHFNNIDARKKFLFMFLWQLYNNCILKVMDDEKTDYENGLFIFIKKNIMK